MRVARNLVWLSLTAALLLPGCVFRRKQPPPATNPQAATAPKENQKLIVTPERFLAGRVVRSNTALRFVVVNFPFSHYPKPEQRLGVYRNGLKVGEITVTGPQLEDNFVANIRAGQAEVGDDVRED